ncbi:MAG: hypothetical protein Q9184_002853 [Pyrenodesmia sp. 2 TL-2023]
MVKADATVVQGFAHLPGELPLLGNSEERVLLDDILLESTSEWNARGIDGHMDERPKKNDTKKATMPEMLASTVV